MGRYAVVIGTTSKAREFQFGDYEEARSAANDLWRWAKQHHERGTVSLYEHDGVHWKLHKTVKV